MITLPGGTSTYQTKFPTVENPISEGSRWLNGALDGGDRANVAVDGNGAKGTQAGYSNNDTVACLTGVWGADQMVSAVCRVVDPGPTVGGEVELHVRCNIAPNNNRSYEIGYSIMPGDPYVNIVRWDGTYSQWTQLGDPARGANCYVANGDVIEARIIGQTITAYINGVQVHQQTDDSASKITSGAPGIGFYNYDTNPASAQDNFSLTSFFAGDGIKNVIGGTAAQNQTTYVVTLPNAVRAGSTVIACALEWEGTPGASGVTKTGGTCTIGSIVRDVVRAGSSGVTGIGIYHIPILTNGTLELTYTRSTVDWNFIMAAAEFAGITSVGQTDTNAGTGETHTTHSIANTVGSLIVYVAAELGNVVQTRRWSDVLAWLSNDVDFITHIVQFSVPNTSPVVMTDTWPQDVGWFTAAVEYLSVFPKSAQLVQDLLYG